MLVVGDREAEAGTVSVRTRSGGDQGAVAVDDFVEKARDEIVRKVLGSPSPVPGPDDQEQRTGQEPGTKDQEVGTRR
jgi:hypothetical protein